MRVNVLYFGVLKEIFGRRHEVMELEEPATVEEVLEECRVRGVAPPELMASLAVAVNQEYARAETPLREKDEVALLPPVSGGCSLRVGETV
jgi:molybdopterin converting factor subunit 1